MTSESIIPRIAQLCESGAFGANRFERCEPMADGHAGLTFGLDLRDDAGALRRYILKIGPPGVPRSGSTDIFRQAPLLRALHVAGLAVPDVVWASADEVDLGSPYIVMERLPGRTLIVWEPASSFLDSTVDLAALWIGAAAALAGIHRIPHQSLLAGWEGATTLGTELDRWQSLTRHSADPEWQAMLHRLAAALRRHMPPDEQRGLVHGDFQPGNILYDGGAITGIIDWDLAVIGPQGMDVGWLLMMADGECWAPEWQPAQVAPKRALLRAYADAGGTALEHSTWYQAFSHFRFGAIAGLNLKLHFSGKRVDAIWEKFASSVPILLRTGIEMLDGKGTK